MFDQSNLRLDISVPQASLRQMPRGYVSPQYWDAGVPAAMLNYNLNSYRSSSHGISQTSTYLGLNAGLNLGRWHFRQSSTLNVLAGQAGMPSRRHWQNIASYVQRDLPGLRAQLTVGDAYTNGELFDSVGLRGVQLASDDRMLPESLRGYAPTIRGVADSNARVSVSQNGVVIYQTTVTPGPFVISDLYPTGYGGDLAVSVTEADGRVRTFTVPYASLAQLLRPGVTRFGVSLGEVRDASLLQRPNIAQATVQHGLSNTVTGYAGAVGSEGYAAALLGGALNTHYGALALDITTARTRIPGLATMSGQSVRVSYSKILPQTDTSLTVAAYRYSTRGYLGLRDAMLARDQARRGLPVFAGAGGAINEVPGNTIPGVSAPIRPTDDGYRNGAGLDRQRGRFDLTLSQQLGTRGGSLYANVSTRTYWNRGGTDTQFQLGYNNNLGRVGYSLSASRVRDLLGRNENQYFASLTIPLGDRMHAPTFTASSARDGNGRSLNQAMLSGNAGVDNQFNYGATASHDNAGMGSAGSVNAGYRSPYGQLSASYGKGSGYAQSSLGMAGAVVAFPGGVIFGQSTGDTVAIVSAPDAAGTRVGNAAGVRVNHAGYALVPYLTPYNRNIIELDPRGLPLSVQLESTSSQVTPRAGAVVMVNFKTSSGRSAIVRVRLPDGQPAPFGAQVLDEQQQVLGVVGQAGRLLLRGVQQAGQLSVQWQNADGIATACGFPYQLAPRGKDKAADAYEQIDATCTPVAASAHIARSGT